MTEGCLDEIDARQLVARHEAERQRLVPDAQALEVLALDGVDNADHADHVVVEIGGDAAGVGEGAKCDSQLQ